MNTLLHARTDAILDLVKEETLHDYFLTHPEPITKEEQVKMGEMAKVWFDVIKEDVLKHEVADHMELTPR